MPAGAPAAEPSAMIRGRATGERRDRGTPDRRSAPPERRERGSATVELAAAVPMLAAITLALVGVVALASDQVMVQGAAREGAREAAVSGDPARAVAAARAALPAGWRATVRVTHPTPGRVRVEVRLPARLAPGPGVTLAAAAVAAVEPGPAPAPEGP
jgi:hypothetical protein